MHHELHELINDTLHLCKDPLFPKQILFTTDEDRAFFQKFPVTTPKYKEQEKPIFVSKLPLSPTPLPVRQTPLPLPVEKQPSPPAVDDRPQERVKAVEIRTSAQIKQTLLKIAPTLQLTEEVPDDATAKRISNGWKEKIPDAEVILLACDTHPETLELLKTLGKAIDQNLAKAKILPAEKFEKEKRWDLFLEKNTFRLIIATDGLQELPELMRFYKAIPSRSEYYLDKIPLLQLSKASIYKSLEHKALLWKTLCRILKK